MKGNRPLRTALFVPGNRPDRMDKALDTRADLVILDLEDAVPPPQKSGARGQVAEKVLFHESPRLFVRINAFGSEFMEADLDAIVRCGPGGIMVPKMELPFQVGTIDSLVTEREKVGGLIPGGLELIFLIETALGVEMAFEIAREAYGLGRSVIFAFGAADFCLDVGMELTNDGSEIAYPRARLAVACRAAEIPPPLDSPYMIDIKDQAGLEEDAQRARRLGFQGKLCVHPDQVKVCNRIFSPTVEEIEQARKVVEAFESSKGQGLGALQLDGKFVDMPIVKRARRILEIEAFLKSY